MLVVIRSIQVIPEKVVVDGVEFEQQVEVIELNGVRHELSQDSGVEELIELIAELVGRDLSNDETDCVWSTCGQKEMQREFP